MTTEAARLAMIAKDIGLFEQARKTEDGQSFPARAYAYVPDPESPSTWKLRLWETPSSGETARQVGLAAAALGPGGFRGRRVQIPSGDRPAVVRKVRAAWRRVNPDKSASEMPPGIRENEEPMSLHDLLVEVGKSDTGIREFVSLSEGPETDKEFPVCIIKEGRGSSGYYPKDVLERDGPKAFPVGTKMFMNHASITERVNQPERRVQDLAGVTTVEPFWDEQGFSGPGLYTKCKAFSSHAGEIKEKAAHTGVSIVAAGVKEQGKVNGFKGPIVKEISEGLSIDFVTSPGAGGKALPLAESATDKADDEDERKESTTMSEEDIQRKLEESAAKLKTELEEQYKPVVEENKRLKADLERRKEADFTATAKEFATEEAAKRLKDTNLSEAQKKGALGRVVEAVYQSATQKEDGSLAEPDFREKIGAAVKAEVAYIAEVSGAGKPQDLGRGTNTDTDLPDLDKIHERMAKSFQAMGLSESAAKRAAEGRVQ